MQDSDDFAIKVENVSKTFKLPHEKQTSVKNLFLSSLQGKRSYEKQKVLNDVSFEIKKGEFFGIVGRNGSGKSTLLKLLAGIYTPTEGKIHLKGKLTPFIELGVGFNPELTGRENVFLNGALLGFSRKEMYAMYDEIVAFAELERFMDQKLKNYSSGMQVRLAFSIAIRAKSDVLVLDEVLAVGDAAFQQKCVDVFERYKANKQTVVLVTHDMETVRRFCTRAILINDGVIMDEGEPNKIASKYSRLNRDTSVNDSNDRQTKKTAIHAVIGDEHGKAKRSFETNEIMSVRLQWPEEFQNVKNVGVAIIKNSGEYMFGSNTFNEAYEIKGHSASYKVHLTLGPGKYYIMAGLFGETKHETVEFLEFGPEFTITEEPDDSVHGLVRLTHEWGHADV